jgi:prepilin-type N-terminal cleavage/methylation domain-containing protein
MTPKWHSEKIMHRRPVETHADRVRNQREDHGYTLIEMLVAIVLMGSIVLSIMGGMWAVVRASRQNDSRAKVQAVLGAAGDSIINYKHWNCPETNQAYVQWAQKAASSVGWESSTVAITQYRYWDPSAPGVDKWKPTNSLSPTECNSLAALTPIKTLQKLTITVTSPDGQYTNSLDIVKADIRPEEIRDVTPPTP